MNTMQAAILEQPGQPLRLAAIGRPVPQVG